MVAAPASSLASQLPQVSGLDTKAAVTENLCGSWLASDEVISNTANRNDNHHHHRYSPSPRLPSANRP
jgi:hypothetical protein